MIKRNVREEDALEEIALIEAIFQKVSKKGIYSKEELAALLVVDQNTLEEAMVALCAMSDLFQYDSFLQSFETVATYQPLGKLQIFHYLPEILHDKFLIKTSFITNSTNTDLEKVRLPTENDGFSDFAAVAVTEMQQGGRGRRAKKWISPLAKNLYFSFKYHFPQAALPYLSSLSLRAGIALLEALNTLGIDNAKIKWPNDIWVEGQKLAGILVESTITSKGIDVIVGMGVNNQQDPSMEVVGNHPTNCEAVLGKPLDRNILVATLAQRLYEICQKISSAPETLPNLQKQWESKSCFFDRTVRLMSDKGDEIGKEVGIDASGALLIQYADGSIKPHLSGDLSLRAY